MVYPSYFQNVLLESRRHKQTQTAVRPKLYAVKMVSQNYQTFFKFSFFKQHS